MEIRNWVKTEAKMPEKIQNSWIISTAANSLYPKSMASKQFSVANLRSRWFFRRKLPNRGTQSFWKQWGKRKGGGGHVVRGDKGQQTGVDGILTIMKVMSIFSGDLCGQQDGDN